MSTNFKTFTNADLQACVRISDDKGKLWIIARDVCDCLDIVNATAAIKRLRDSEKLQLNTDGGKGRHRINLISEQGMYELLMRSRKPKAQEFRLWIADEVLPTLRKECSPKEDAVIDPDMLIQLANELKARRAAENKYIENVNVLKGRATRLEHLMGLSSSDSNDWFRVLSIPWLEEYFKLGDYTYKAVGELLETLSKSLDVPVANVPVSRDTTTKVFHRRSVQLLKSMLDKDHNLLKRYRNARTTQ